jgi:hypothetical protein
MLVAGRREPIQPSNARVPICEQRVDSRDAIVRVSCHCGVPSANHDHNRTKQAYNDNGEIV